MSLFNKKTLMITGGTGSFGNAVLNHFISDGGWGRLLLKCLIIVIFYLLSVILLGLSKKERKVISEKIRFKFCKHKIKEDLKQE